MKHIMLFENFRNVGGLNPDKFPIIEFPIIEEILLKSESFLDDVVNKISTDYKEKTNRDFSSYDIKMCYYGLVFDLIKSLTKNLDKNDILKDLDVKLSKGVLAISATIERVGKDYALYTEGIYAGGYNIQTLHIRYITKTNLPKINNDGIIQSIKNQITKLTKDDKINKEILYYEDVLSRKNKEFDKMLNMTEEEILDASNYRSMEKQGWDDSNSFVSDVHKSQETFDSYMSDLKIETLNRHKRFTNLKKKDIKDINNKIEKLRKILAE